MRSGSSPSFFRQRSATPQMLISHTRLRKVPPVRQVHSSFRARAQDQARIRRLADLEIDRFNTGRMSLLQEKKADWGRQERKLFSRAKRRWLYISNSPEVQAEVGRIRTEDVLNASVEQFSRKAYGPVSLTLTYGS